MKRQLILVGLCGLTIVTATLGTVCSVRASEEGRRNTALVLGGAAIYELLKGRNTEAIVLGAGSAYAFKRYEELRHANSLKRNANRLPPVLIKRNGKYYAIVDRDDRPLPPGWNHGRKTGWGDHNMPPGQWKKHHGDGNDDADGHGHGHGHGHDDN